MKRKMLSVLGCTAAAFTLSLAGSFTSMASSVEGTAVETENVATADEEAFSQEPQTTEDATVDTVSEWDGRVMANVQYNVNVRQGPSTETERIGLLYKGGAGDIVERGEEWTLVRSGNVEGYIYNQYLLFGEEAEQLAQELSVTIASVEARALNVRKEPTIESTCLKSVPEGTQLNVVQELDGWVEINLGKNTTAYVSADYVTIETKLGEAKSMEEIAAAERAARPKAAAGNVQQAPAPQTDTAAQSEPDAPAEPAEVIEEAEEAVSQDVVYEEPAPANQGDLDLLAAIIECEAGGESYEGKIAVGAVVMNRVRSSSFPNTISGVIYQSGQFSPVAEGKLAAVLSRGARSDCYTAAQDALNGANNVGGCLFFHAGGGNGIQIGNQTFY